MHIRETFGPVWDASGLRGFFGEGYWFHRLIPGLSFKDATFVSKTVTTFPNAGNMAMTEDYAPQRLFPDCIYVDLLRGITLNSVGLSGPGFMRLLDTGRWAQIEEPFFISWMPIAKDEQDIRNEALEFVRFLQRFGHLMLWRQIGIQLNVSCPNVGADLQAVAAKADMLLTILEALRLPIIVKLNLLVPPETAAQIAKHPACMGISITNTAPFGTVLPKEEWLRLFPDGSPLRKRNDAYGDGGLSGPFLLPYVLRWIKEFRYYNSSTHVNAGGGIWRADDVDRLKKAGADSIFIGTVAMHRPWRVRGIIKRAHKVFS